jgi:hypothetical protein
MEKYTVCSALSEILSAYWPVGYFKSQYDLYKGSQPTAR